MPKLWYRKARDMWYTTVGGKQLPLGVRGADAESLAEQAFSQLPAAPAAPPPHPTVADAVGAYLAGVAGTVAPLTLRGYRGYLRRFTTLFGPHPIDTVGECEIEGQCRLEKWSNSTSHNYLSTVEACLRWNGRHVRMRKPPKESAGADSVIDEGTYKKLLIASSGDVQVLIRFLWATGCRPGEATGLTCEGIDWPNRCARIREHKMRHRGKTRTLHLSPEAIDLLAHQRDKYGGAGYLFRSRAGLTLDRMRIVRIFLRLSATIGRRVTAYMFRHTYATRALAGGESDAVVAALLGHANTAMIWKHYGHVSQMGRQLSEAANRIAVKNSQS